MKTVRITHLLIHHKLATMAKTLVMMKFIESPIMESLENGQLIA